MLTKKRKKVDKSPLGAYSFALEPTPSGKNSCVTSGNVSPSDDSGLSSGVSNSDETVANVAPHARGEDSGTEVAISDTVPRDEASNAETANAVYRQVMSVEADGVLNEGFYAYPTGKPSFIQDRACPAPSADQGGCGAEMRPDILKKNEPNTEAQHKNLGAWSKTPFPSPHLPELNNHAYIIGTTTVHDSHVKIDNHFKMKPDVFRIKNQPMMTDSFNPNQTQKWMNSINNFAPKPAPKLTPENHMNRFCQQSGYSSNFVSGDFDSAPYQQKRGGNGPPSPNSTILKDTDNLASFADSSAGGVAFALPHGSVLFECAKQELHATTALKKPNRKDPNRISIVFYQHKKLIFRNHGALDNSTKLSEKKEVMEKLIPEDKVNIYLF